MDVRAFLALAFVAPIAFFPLVSLVHRDDTPLETFLKSVSTAWMGFSLLAVVVITGLVVQGRRMRRAVLVQVPENAPLIVSIVASRYRHYQSREVGDPLSAAVGAVGAYLRAAVPTGVAAQWVMDGADWFDAEATTGALPLLPSLPVDTARQFTEWHGQHYPAGK